MAVIHAEKLIAADYHGLADIEAGRPVDENTIFHWASITKTFTAVAIMQLRDRGLLELTDPAVRYVPELREVHNPFGGTERITLGHLLSHTAGFRARTWPWGGDETWHPFEPREWTQLVAMMPYSRILFEPGSEYGYSNPAFIFLGRTVEKIVGDDYKTYIHKNLLEPLGMHASYFNATPWHRQANRSNSYHVIDGRPVANGADFNTGITAANGGLNATMPDMGKWIAFLMDSTAAHQPIHRQVLSPASLEEMRQPLMPVHGPAVPGLEHEQIGLSLFLYEHQGHRLVGHTGSQMSFSSFILYDPDADIGVVGVYNTAYGDETAPDTGRISREFRVRAVKEIFSQFWTDEGAAD